MNNIKKFLIKNSSNILTIIGIGGVIGTTYSGIKSTIKAVRILDEVENKELCDNKTKFKLVYKEYIPTAILASGTIFCILGANYLNKKSQASLASAYMLLEKSYSNYKDKVMELYENSDTIIKEKISKDLYDPNINVEDKELFFDFTSMQWYVSTFNEVKNAERIILDCIKSSGVACVNDYYDFLGLKTISDGFLLGWDESSISNKNNMNFIYEKYQTDDGMEYCIVTMPDLIPLDCI